MYSFRRPFRLPVQYHTEATCQVEKVTILSTHKLTSHYGHRAYITSELVNQGLSCIRTK